MNGHKICHGGLIFTLADSAFAFACNTYDVVTVASAASIEFLLPGAARRRADGDRRGAIAFEAHRCVRRGRAQSARANASRCFAAARMRSAARIAYADSRTEAAGPGADRDCERRRAARPAAAASAMVGAARVRERRALSRELPRRRRASAGPALARGSREVSVHGEGRSARQLSVRDVRGAARAKSSVCMRRAARPASRRSSATPRRTSTRGRCSWRAPSVPPAVGRATSCTSRMATVCSPAVSALTTAPSVSAAR